MKISWAGDAVLLAARRMAEEGVSGAAQAVKIASLARVPVASGALRGSCEVTVSGRQAVVSYGTDHAVAVHEGARGRAGRPFLKEALDAVDVAVEMGKRIRL